MPKRVSDPGYRVFFDELLSTAASPLKAMGVIRLEDQRALIPFGEQTKLIGVAPPFSKTAARGPSSFAQNAAEGPKSFGSSMVHYFFSLFLSPTAR
jgi:hypothetical protein